MQTADLKRGVDFSDKGFAPGWLDDLFDPDARVRKRPETANPVNPAAVVPEYAECLQEALEAELTQPPQEEVDPLLPQTATDRTALRLSQGGRRRNLDLRRPTSRVPTDAPLLYKDRLSPEPRISQLHRIYGRV